MHQFQSSAGFRTADKARGAIVRVEAAASLTRFERPVRVGADSPGYPFGYYEVKPGTTVSGPGASSSGPEVPKPPSPPAIRSAEAENASTDPGAPTAAS